MAGFIGYSGWCAFNNAVLTSTSDHGESKAAFAKWVQKIQLLSPVAEAPLAIPDIEVALQTPMLIEHAQDDYLVPLALGGNLRDNLGQLGAIVQWREYADGGHWINEPQGIDGLVYLIGVKTMEKIPLGKII
jgi:lysophospholipase-2